MLCTRLAHIAVAIALITACGDDGGGDVSDANSTADAALTDGAPGADAPVADGATVDASSAAFTLTSTGFTEGSLIPVQFTCDGADISPQLAWSGAPVGTMSFAFVMKDITNPTPFLHSAAWEIPVARSSLPEDVPNSYQPFGAGDLKQARSWNGADVGYAGPCPPGLNTYEYAIYAMSVDSLPALSASSNRQTVFNAIEVASLAKATLTGMYERP